jgi:hypothetical protein
MKPFRRRKYRRLLLPILVAAIFILLLNPAQFSKDKNKPVRTELDPGISRPNRTELISALLVIDTSTLRCELLNTPLTQICLC